MKQQNKIHYSRFLDFKTVKILAIYLVAILSFNILHAQTTLNTTAVAGWSNNNGTGNVTFNFQNTNAYPIIITGIEGISGTAGATTAELWSKPTPISGSPGNISVANGWTQLATGTFTAVANTTTLVTQPMLTGLSVTIPAGVTIGMCVTAYSGTSTRQRYHSMVSPNIPTTTVSGGGCNIIMGTNISYGGGLPGATPINTPRGWIGKLTFIPASPCIDPPTAGTPTATATTICTGQSTIISLTGGTGGTGQSYQWESSTVSGGPYTTGPTTASITVSPTTNTYYRCTVTCGSNSSTSSEILITVPLPFPGGFYTIDNTLSTGGGNFASFAEAVSAIACGISGPIVFDVAPGTGPYNEQVTIPQIGGASATNTITFNGYNETLTFNATGSSYHTFGLNGADYIRVNDLNIIGTGTTALVGHLWNNADNNIFTNCTFTAPANGTSTTQVPFSCSGSEISATTAGLSGSNNELIGCTMTSGYYNTCFVGNSAAGLASTGNKVINCNLVDQYFYGSYNLYQNGMIIRGNNLSRPTRSTLSTYYGIYVVTGCTNMLVENNKIHDTWAAAPNSTGTQYSIYCSIDASAGNENKFYNNLISDINFNGTIYGMYMVGADYFKAYHNTISLDQTTATGTTTTYGIYCSGTVAYDVRNNNVTISRGGTGVKYAMTCTSPAVATSNYNNLYVSSTTGTNCVGFTTVGYATLAAWQATGLDLNSTSVDPAYNNPLGGDYRPTSVNLDNTGLGLGITSDITGLSRSATTPDLGAYEFQVSPTDGGVLSFDSPGNSGCYSTTQDVVVTIKNFGSLPLDFALNPMVVTCDVNGPVTATLTGTPTGVLAPGATQTVVLGPTFDMSLNGTYSFTVTSSTVGDGNAINDALGTVPTRNVSLIAGVLNSPQTSVCISSPPTLSLTGNYGGNLQWQESYVSPTGPWTNVGSGGQTYVPSFTITSTGDVFYQVVSTCNSNTSTSNVLALTVTVPELSGTTSGSRCGTGTVALGATASGGANINWYATPTGGTPLGNGTSFTTPVISSTTDFYAEAVSGAGTLTSLGNTSFPTASGFNAKRGIQFNAYQSFTLNSFDFPAAFAGTTTMTVELQDAAGVVLQTGTFSETNANAALSWHTVTLNWLIPAGTGLKLLCTFNTGSLSNYSHSSGADYASTAFNNLGPVGIITNGLEFGPVVSTTTYYYFYNLSITAGCNSLRTPVTATVTTSPSISVSSSATTICAGDAVTLSVSSPNDPDYTYTWNPGGLTGSSVIVNPLASTTYTVTALDNTAGPNAGCGNLATVSIVVNPILVSLNPTVSSSTPACVGNNVNLIANAIAPGYIMNAASTTAFVDISATGADITGLGDDTEHNISIPSFTFNGTAYTTARVGVNGVIVLGSTAGEVSLTNATLPSTANTAGNVFLAPYWDDLDIQTVLTIKTQTIGNVHIIQFTNAAHNNFTTGGITFQVQLDLVSGTITYVYSDVTFGDVLYDAGVNATVGIQMSSTSALQYSFNTASLVAGQAISFSPNSATVAWSGPNGFNSALPNPVLTSVTNLESGVYTVTATGSNGCTTSSTVNLVVNTPTSSTTSQSIPCAGSYVWNGNTYTASGIYTFTTTGSNGCDSVASLNLTVLPCNTTLNLTAFIQGYWDGTSAMLPVLLNQGQPNTATECDNITVELISPATVAGGAPYTPDYTTTAMLNTNGTANAVFTSAVSGNYYIVIKHRNALQTWSANAMSFPTTTSYDFSSAASQAYGSNQAEIATGVWALFSGDLVVDENMDLLDLGLVEADISAFSFGYLPTDINGDGNVDLLDSPVLETNISNFVFSAHP